MKCDDFKEQDRGGKGERKTGEENETGPFDWSDKLDLSRSRIIDSHRSLLVRLFAVFDVAEEDVGLPIGDRVLLVEPHALQVGVMPLASDALDRA